jgi:hypothetical protein
MKKGLVMLVNSSTLPTAGRPLRSVLQINRALREGADVYAELADGSVQQIRLSRRKGPVFQVQVATDQTWSDEPRRVWASKAKATSAASSEGEVAPGSKVQIRRTPVGNLGLEELQAQCFQAPLWLEAPEGDLVIMPQFARRHLALKHWKREQTVQSARTLTELVAFMRAQEWTNRLLDADEQSPLRSWQIATPTIIE